MELRGIRFHYAFGQSGVQNIDGSGYWYHQYLKHIGLTFRNCTFVAKTVTRYAQGGHMPLKEDGITPRDRFPDCIYVRARSWLHGVAINAIGLSNFGLDFYLNRRVWHTQREPFWVSLMCLEKDIVYRRREIQGMVRAINASLPFGFGVPFGVQLNVSCPNVDHAESTVEETREHLAILRKLGNEVALGIKLNVNFDVEAAIEIANDPSCDCIFVSNTLHWSELTEYDRYRLFRRRIESPLAKYGGGGVSGSILLPELLRWLKKARSRGLNKPIVAGGGILKPSDVDRVADAGASAVAVGSVAFLRPWQMQRIIDRANYLGRDGFYWKKSVDSGEPTEFAEKVSRLL